MLSTEKRVNYVLITPLLSEFLFIFAAPLLTTPNAGSGTSQPLNEDANIRDTVIGLSSTDEDGDSPTYSIVAQSVANAFDISGTNLITSMVFDYESAVKTYEVTIM